jgi:hypothetical protein
VGARRGRGGLGSHLLGCYVAKRRSNQFVYSNEDVKAREVKKEKKETV